MNQADLMLKIVERAQAGGALPVEEAIAQIARLINLLDPHAVHYQADVGLASPAASPIDHKSLSQPVVAKQVAVKPRQRHGGEMNQTDVMRKIVELASVGAALEPEEAVARVAALIAGLDMHRATYEADVAALAQIGVTIWAMDRRPG
jgi:hypothetical protein